MQPQQMTADFMAAAEIMHHGNTWARNPVMHLRALKNASKQLYNVRMNFREVAASNAFRAAEAAMNRVCDSVVSVVRPAHMPFAARFEINWKLATMLSRMCRYEEALEFAERAEMLVPQGDPEKIWNVTNKKGFILVELEKIRPGRGYGEQAVELAKLLFAKTGDEQDRRLLGRALFAVGRRDEAHGIFDHRLALEAL